MNSTSHAEIVIKGARTNNLKDISIKIPHNKFIVVAGISGSGKSSLVFEIIAKEGQRRYFETLPSFARQFMGKLNRPDVDEIEGLSPVISIGQKTAGMHARSTVGTMSDIYDLLRLLYARTGVTDLDLKLSRALFSFNSDVGKCVCCKGVGKEEKIDLDRLVIHPEKSIRDGALAPTLPNGYIMYSQVTIDVLNKVCEAEGFDVDIPWNNLTDYQKQVILYGSDKIKVPFGKHSLESRLKWTGIKAKPREEGFYKGMIPIMSDILRRDRNANILKYVHAVTCHQCKGTRLNTDALSVLVHGKSIAEVVKMELNELKIWIHNSNWNLIATSIVQKIEAQIDLLEDLGLGHLTVDRPSKSLRASEIQRIRIANQILVPLSDVLYVFDEPSIGLHQEENERLIYHFQELVRKGNTVIVVEHDLQTISNADHLIEIGPNAGADGGEVIYNGIFVDFQHRVQLEPISPTFRAFYGAREKQNKAVDTSCAAIQLFGCHERNLKDIDVEFKLGQMNVISGRSGVGKSSLVKGTLLPLINHHLGVDPTKPDNLTQTKNLEAINKLIFIDHTPIGKTPRSNPATYLGLSDHIRDIFASLPESKSMGFTKSRFSFNNKGGRCETCQGAGKTQVGMHFLGNVDLVCGTCNGDRFNQETLAIQYQGKSIADCYQMSVDEAISFFVGQRKVLAGLLILQEIGLGYLTLGQSSTTLSGGEAQRIKIANQLQKKDSGDTLYVIIEPSIGLHHNDVKTLLMLFDRIKKQGNTIVCIEQDEVVIEASDWHIELGVRGGKEGGFINYQGIPRKQAGKMWNSALKSTEQAPISEEIILQGITTHGLKNIDVCIPKNQLTVVTGVSGSGKSSLVYDTLFAESNARFTESLSTYNRSFLQQNSEAKMTQFSGLGPAIGINRRGGSPSKRSTVGTLSSVYDAFRLLYSRIAQQEGEVFTAQHFSYNHHLGACPSCEGLGLKHSCDPEEVVFDIEKSIYDGALSSNKALSYYTDPNGQFMATLREVERQNKFDFDRPWNALSKEEQQVILYGTGKSIWDVEWTFTTKTRSGTQSLKTKWLGFCNYIDDEFERKRHNKNIKHLEEMLHDLECPLCHGSRLKKELLSTTFLGKNIYQLTEMSIRDCLNLLEITEDIQDKHLSAISEVIMPSVKASLSTLGELGLDYLSLDRPIASLSGGERQRVTLAGQLATHLFGVTYVLDEPTIGLDDGQVQVLTKLLRALVEKGNTVVVVEHDPTFIKSVDYLIELGPGAGNLGGEVMFQGCLADVAKAKNTVTYKLLHGQRKVRGESRVEHGPSFGLKGAYANNLKHIDVAFNSGQITAVTGVSGSGKSSLIKDVLYSSWLKKRAYHCDSTFGFEQFDQVILIDQKVQNLGRLMTPSSYTGVLEDLRGIYAKTAYAKKAGLKKGDFSYQSKVGKCPACSGHGKQKTSMDFMSDIWLTCDVCRGLRYSKSVLHCRIDGQSIGDILQMTVCEVGSIFKEGAIADKLTILQKVGLAHIVLGQGGNTLSGGEGQRLTLARALMQKRKGTTLYLFDEPSTGLHYFDILPLVEVFQELIDKGDTVVFIEHNKTMIESADRVIKLGPGSGVNGGDVMKNLD